VVYVSDVCVYSILEFILKCSWQKVAVRWLALLLHILKVLGSDLENTYPECVCVCVSWFSSVPPNKLGYSLAQDNDSSVK
jgi:hypothetical protein